MEYYGEKWSREINFAVVGSLSCSIKSL